MYFDFYSLKDWVGTHPLSLKTVYKLYTTQEYKSNHRIIESDKYILFYTLDGTGQIQVDGSLFHAQVNTIIIARASHSLAYHCTGDEWNFWLFEFKTEPLLLEPNHVYRLPFKLEFFTMCDQTLFSLKEGQQHLASAHFYLFYSTLVRELQYSSKTYYAEVIYKSVAFMKDYIKTFSVQLLAQYLNIPLRTLIYIFKKETGTSPIHYFQRVRIEAGKAYVETTEMTVSDIAHTLGYSNAGHFSAAFKQYTGTSPMRYRREFNLQNIG